MRNVRSIDDVRVASRESRVSTTNRRGRQRLRAERATITERLFERLGGMAEYKEALREITAESNDDFITLIEDVATQFSGWRPAPQHPPT
jgi:hypothetical protein